MEISNLRPSNRILKLLALFGLAGGKDVRNYRQRGGPRTHMIPDFLIAAHANAATARLAVDRGYFRPFFADLEVVQP